MPASGLAALAEQYFHEAHKVNLSWIPHSARKWWQSRRTHLSGCSSITRPGFFGDSLDLSNCEAWAPLGLKAAEEAFDRAFLFGRLHHEPSIGQLVYLDLLAGRNIQVLKQVLCQG